MHPDLVRARDAAAQRHDVAMERHSTSFGEPFASEMQQVIADLDRIIAAAETKLLGPPEPVELAKTCRFLGDAYFDHGRFSGRPSRELGVQAYRKAEALLAGVVAPVERAKLDCNFASTLSALSEGTDIALMEAAAARYERATKAFRENGLPAFERMVAGHLESLRPLLTLARDRLSSAMRTGALDRLQVAAVAKLAQGVPGMPTVDQLLAALSTAPKTQASSGEASDPVAGLAGALLDCIRADAAAGVVSPDRADHLSQLLSRFIEKVPAPGDDLCTHEEKVAGMRDLMLQVADTLQAPSWRTPAPVPATRGARAAAMLDSLRDYLLGEKAMPMLPSREAEATTAMFARVEQLAGLVRDARDDCDRIANLEDRIWRIALDVQQHARRYHLVVASPDFAMLAEQAPAKSLFVSGNEVMRAAAVELAQRGGISLSKDARRAEVGQERWSQLLAASVAAFDMGLPDGALRAQVAYELGLALALGKPCVVVAHEGTVIPFDIEVPPVVFGADAEKNVAALQAGVDEALSAVTRGGRTPRLGDAGKAALDAMQRHISRFASPSDQLAVQLRMCQANAGDAVGLRRSLQNIVGTLGAGGPALLFPAWPPPPPAPEPYSPRCFHVTPFKREFDSARDELADTCRRQGWRYVRGNDSADQRIVRGIWRELCHASAVVVDITGHNVNVALELGLVHALGRPYRIVAHGDPEPHRFPSISKVQTHGYEATGRSLKEVAGDFLAGVDKAGTPH